MTSHHWSYDLLKELIAQKNISPRELEELKESFADDIGSARRLSSIRTLADLLDVLERRDEFNENNIQALKDIGDYLRDENIVAGASQYALQLSVDSCSYDEKENEYACRRLEEDMQEKVRISRLRNPELQDNVQQENSARIPNNPVDPYLFKGKKREAIYKLISTEIGRKWRDLGREIGIREGEMDNFEADYPRDSKLKVRKMLELYEEDERVDPRRIVHCLCIALEECRRRDLSQRVQEIMTR